MRRAAFVLLVISACGPGSSSVTGPNDAGASPGGVLTDGAASSGASPVGPFRGEVSVIETTSDGAVTTVATAAFSQGAHCKVESLPGHLLKEASCVLRSCDAAPSAVPVAIGDVTVTCGETLTMTAQGTTYAPAHIAGAACHGSGSTVKTTSGLYGFSTGNGAPGGATVSSPNLATDTTFARSGGFYVSYSDSTTSDEMLVRIMGKGADGSDADLLCFANAVAGETTIVPATMARLAAGPAVLQIGTVEGDTTFAADVLFDIVRLANHSSTKAPVEGAITLQ